MKTKKEILKTVKNIINENGISIYNLAAVTGINRSTLQKALSGDRGLNLRQFRALLDVLPISPVERTDLYRRYIMVTMDKEAIEKSRVVVDVLDAISHSLEDDRSIPVSLPIHNEEIPAYVTGLWNVTEVVKRITVEAVSEGKDADIYAYVPLDTDFFASTVSYCVEKGTGRRSVSLLFEFLKPNNNKDENPLVLKNMMAMLMSRQEIYTMHFMYTDSYFYNNHMTPYPYYIVYPETVVFLTPELDSMVVVRDKGAIERIRGIHMGNMEKASPLSQTVMAIDDMVAHLMQVQFSGDMYAISYTPCISSFTPPAMYNRIINDAFPRKEEFIQLIERRIKAIDESPRRFALFKGDSVMEFARGGHLFIKEHRYLNKCTVEERIIILKNVLAAMDDPNVVLRAIDERYLHISDEFEITNVQGLHSFNILVTADDGYTKLVDINEPVISSYFVDFIRLVLDTPAVYTLEESKDIVREAIEALEQHRDDIW